MSAIPPLLQHSFPRLQDGMPQPLGAYAGKVLLVVNTASYCGFTPQYAGLQQLYAEGRERGLVVLGFPSNEFGGQEPAGEQEIARFCESHFDVDFPMFAKTTVSEGRANPFHAARAEATGKWPQWNFHKYLIDRSATRVLSFASAVPPDAPQLLLAVDRLLDEPAHA